MLVEARSLRKSQFLHLVALLQARMAHLMRTFPREALATRTVHGMRLLDAAVSWRAAAVLDVPPGVVEYATSMEGPDKVSSMLGRQILFLLRLSGLGLRMQPDEVLDAAFVASVGQPERNLKERPTARCPQEGTKRRLCGRSAAAATSGTQGSADGPQQPRTCHWSSWTAGRGYLGRSS